uniref:Odorant receptor n=1 Tax=Vespula pensylvanica TaxID=30213 RepID=A0A834JHD5_VESPE|nr:hypothetical protein H0235_018423 [Vespula pensylvanica]
MKLHLRKLVFNRCLEVATNGSMLTKREDYIYKEYYSYNRRFFRLIGLWQSPISFKKMIYISFINFMLAVGSSVQMQKIRYRIKCDWGILENKPELELLKKYADVSRRCTVIIAVSFYLNIAFKIFPSLLCVFQYVFGSTNFTELILPFHIEYSMGNQMKYFFTLFYQYVILIIVATLGIANYSMFIAVIQHACALFYIVEWRVIEKFKKDPHNIYYARTSSDLAKENEWIIDIIQFYNNAIEFVSHFTTLRVCPFIEIFLRNNSSFGRNIGVYINSDSNAICELEKPADSELNVIWNFYLSFGEKDMSDFLHIPRDCTILRANKKLFSIIRRINSTEYV